MGPVALPIISSYPEDTCYSSYLEMGTIYYFLVAVTKSLTGNNLKEEGFVLTHSWGTVHQDTEGILVET